MLGESLYSVLNDPFLYCIFDSVLLGYLILALQKWLSDFSFGFVPTYCRDILTFDLLIFLFSLQP